MSLPLDDTIEILRSHLKDSTLLNAIAKDLIRAEKEVKESKADATPAAKTRLVVLARGDAAMQASLSAGAWVVSVPDDDTTNTYAASALIDRLRKAAVEHNEAPKARRAKSKRRVGTWNDLFTLVKAKTLKASGSQIGIKVKGVPSEVVILTTETIVAQ